MHLYIIEWPVSECVYVCMYVCVYVYIYILKFKLLLYVEMDLQEQLCKKQSSIININAVTDQSEWTV